MAEIYNEESNTLLSGTSDDDSIYNGVACDYFWHSGGSNVTIDGGDGNDYIENDGASVTIDGGAGDDNVKDFSGGNNIFISGSLGNDSIYCGKSGYVTISGDDGDDSISIEIESGKLSISGGVGNDFIWNGGSTVTINCGTGDDTIYNYYDEDYDDDYSSNVLIQYSLGDENDIIYGFRDDSTLLIAGDSYSSEISGDDVIVTVGDGKITLVGAASLSAVNIDGVEKSNPLSIIGTDSADNIKETVDGATIPFATH